ncbi:MAG: peptide deformylase [Candidatus Marinimicrobia bacterium]|nr:peptide deformylase [Candidatus Neomarinimicrobiota bacterium]|tara:strand:+ start:2325 stop:2870 length:546 start_codon:yes stop_codon:yes gene_type:complete
MMDIVTYGNPILNRTCKVVKSFSNIESIIDDMFDTMYEAEGIGLAANQVGLDMNIFIIDVTHTDETDDTHIFINSKILSIHGEKKYFQEGCLSLPGIALDVERPEKILLKYQTMDKKWHKNEFSGLLSRAIQHEMDHLNGVFIVDRVSEVEKIKYKNQLKILELDSKKHLKKSLDQKRFLL